MLTLTAPQTTETEQRPATVWQDYEVIVSIPTKNGTEFEKKRHVEFASDAEFAISRTKDLIRVYGLPQPIHIDAMPLENGRRI